MPVNQALDYHQAGYVAQLASVALGGILLALILVAALHLLSPEFSPMRRAMSDYVHSRYGLLMTAAFAGLGSSLLALAEAFRQIASSALQSSGGLLLATAGTATLLAGIFPIDNTPDGRFNTARGAAHAAAGFALSPLLVGAMLMLSAPWNRIGDNDLLQAIALGSAAVNAGAFAALLIVNGIRVPIGGIGQRVFMALVCIWLLLTSFRLLMLASAGG
ncbi:MAG: DUF998 domain-containing protein [Chloroflexi bacterium]|nr:DUF998 domain-containing protein [Chloroflexota bacterium]